MCILTVTPVIGLTACSQIGVDVTRRFCQHFFTSFHVSHVKHKCILVVEHRTVMVVPLGRVLIALVYVSIAG